MDRLIYSPEKEITDDYVAHTVEDAPYCSMTYKYVYDIAGIPLFLLVPCNLGLVCLAGLAALAAGLAVVLRPRRR